MIAKVFTDKKSFMMIKRSNKGTCLRNKFLIVWLETSFQHPVKILKIMIDQKLSKNLLRIKSNLNN